MKIGTATRLVYKSPQEGENSMEKESALTLNNESATDTEPQIIEEIAVEELSIDGVCGVY
jgi:mycofactocin precursor